MASSLYLPNSALDPSKIGSDLWNSPISCIDMKESLATVLIRLQAPFWAGFIRVETSPPKNIRNTHIFIYMLGTTFKIECVFPVGDCDDFYTSRFIDPNARRLFSRSYRLAYPNCTSMNTSHQTKKNRGACKHINVDRYKANKSRRKYFWKDLWACNNSVYFLETSKCCSYSQTC